MDEFTSTLQQVGELKAENERLIEMCRLKDERITELTVERDTLKRQYNNVRDALKNMRKNLVYHVDNFFASTVNND